MFFCEMALCEFGWAEWTDFLLAALLFDQFKLRQRTRLAFVFEKRFAISFVFI